MVFFATSIYRNHLLRTRKPPQKSKAELSSVVTRFEESILQLGTSEVQSISSKHLSCREAAKGPSN